MNRVLDLLLALMVCATLTSADANIKTAAKQLVSDVRTLASQAKSGMPLAAIRQGALDLRSDASDLQQLLPGEAAECEVDLVIKMAAAGVGSHEVLTLLLADGHTAVLDGRMALSFAFLERVAQQLEDKLVLSPEIGAELAAVVFGTNATASIAETADVVVTDVINQDGGKAAATRRKRGGNWDVGLGGVTWTSSNGAHTFNAKPTFSGGLGGRLSYTFRF